LLSKAQVGQFYHWDKNDHEGEEVEIESSKESFEEPVDHGVEAVERHVLRDTLLRLGLFARLL
jgi:hypothetical protein